MNRLQKQIAKIRHVVGISLIVGDDGDIMFVAEFSDKRGIRKDEGFEGVELLKEFVHQNVVFHVVHQATLQFKSNSMESTVSGSMEEINTRRVMGCWLYPSTNE